MINALRSPGGRQLKVCVMSLANFERFLDRGAPALFLALGLIVAVAVLGVAI